MYDHGIVNHNDDEKIHGEQYLQQAANLYCLPALNFLEWLYTEEGPTKLAALVKQKMGHYMADELRGRPADVIRYVIQESMFDTLLVPFSPSCCGCQRKRGVVTELHAIDPAEHFRESFLDAFDTLNKAFYGDASAHLDKVIGGIRRSSYLTTQSRFWRVSSILTPLATMGISAAQLWSGYQTMPAGTPQDAQDIISTLTRNALGSLVTSTITFSYGAWVLYKSSDIVKLNTDVLRDQCILTALYLTVNKGTGAMPKAGETEGEGVINRWFQETTGFGLFSKKQTLSQRILNRR